MPDKAARRLRRGLPILFLTAVLVVWPGAESPRAQQTSTFTPHADVRDVLRALADVLPPELANGPSQAIAWPKWIAAHDEAIRSRIERGDADTLVNWLLFGTSFTSQKRVFLDSGVGSGDLGRTDASPPPTATLQETAALIATRINDLVSALAAPGTDERRLFARQALERRGFPVDTPAGRARAMDHLRTEVSRLLAEQQVYARELENARALGDPSADFAARSRLYRERGLSLDTLVQPNFALEQALKRMKDEGLLTGGSIRRVAVIGPGLDFADKTTGYDFYPLQTLQPFALIDSLQRLRLADAQALELTAFDINARVVQHVANARARAQRGLSYTVRLPLDQTTPWSPELNAYWAHVGDTIGTETPAPAPTRAGTAVRARTLAIRPSTVLRITAADLNIVTSRPVTAPFDLVVATNVFVYYDTLDQALALTNVSSLLRPGAFLLSNNALLELPTSDMRSMGSLSVPYSSRPDDGDHMVWYQRSRERR